MVQNVVLVMPNVKLVQDQLLPALHAPADFTVITEIVFRVALLEQWLAVWLASNVTPLAPPVSAVFTPVPHVPLDTLSQDQSALKTAEKDSTWTPVTTAKTVDLDVRDAAALINAVNALILLSLPLMESARSDAQLVHP